MPAPTGISTWSNSQAVIKENPGNYQWGGGAGENGIMLSQQGDLEIVGTHHTRHIQLLFVLKLPPHNGLLLKL